ncbi:hypothetical protein BANRA_05036 [Escherichia coli]|nr:hypothetical protein BANRA_05036 [Escherichia coli]VCZ66517.1 hypothetical protein BANRA_05725 [Escherichia coli]
MKCNNLFTLFMLFIAKPEVKMNQKWKTLIVSVLTPSSIISGIALIVLWGYFSRLDRLDIFFDVMNIKSILVLVCCTTILSLIMIILFFITSFYTNSYSL